MTEGPNFAGIRLAHVERFSEAVISGVAGATVVVFDRDLRILVADGAAYSRHGTAPESLVGRQMVDVLPAEAWRSLRDHYRAALAGERRSFEHRSTDGAAVYWIHISPFRDEDGTIVGGVAVSQDITERTEGDAERRAEAEHAALAFADAPIGMAVLTLEGAFLRVNPALCRMLGHPADELVGRSYLDYAHPDEVAGSRADLLALRSGRSQHESERRYVRSDGSEAWARVSTTPLRAVGRRQSVIFAQVQDVTHRRVAEEHLRRRLRQQSEVAELGRRALAGDPLEVLLDSACAALGRALGVEVSGYLEWSAEDERFTLRAGLGWAAGEVGRLQVPDGTRSSAGYAVQAGGAVVTPDLRAERRFEAPVLIGHGVVSSVSAVVGGLERPLGVIGAHARHPLAFDADDISFVQGVANVLAETMERRHAEDRVRHRALHDPLTELPNRAHFLERLTEALGTVTARPSEVAVFLLDIDDFKAVNDSLGHYAGDALLAAIAGRLREVVRDGDVIARLGGDEFAVLSPALRGEQQAHEVAERLLSALLRPFEVGGQPHYVQASAGVVTAVDGTRDAEALLRDADAAMYRAKERGRNRYEVLTEEVRARAVDRLRVGNELRRALAQGELRVHYQPFFALGSTRPVGAEALVRWEHPERGLLAPGAFLPVAEESGLVVALGEWVLREACTRAARWREQLGDSPFMLTVNVAARQFGAPALPEVVRDALGTSGLTPGALGLEVTEGALSDAHADPAGALEALKAVGVTLLLDDFGVGFSSLTRLKRMPIDVVKIDRSFVEQLARPGSRDSAIVEAIMGMARALDMDVIAEGVETADQAASLQVLGCRVAQGFLLGRPQPPEHIDRLTGLAAS